MSLDLTAIRERVNAATPGPWQQNGHVVDMGLPPTSPFAVCHSDTPKDAVPNAEFIAHARTDVPALLAEIDRLRAQVDAAYRFAEQMGDYCSPHGVASRYAGELRAALDNAKEA